MNINQGRVKTWRRCKQQHFYQFRFQHPSSTEVLGIVPKVTKYALRQGSIIHLLLETLARDDDFETILDKLEEEFSQGKMFVEEREYYGDLVEKCVSLVEGYVDYYEDEPIYYDHVEKVIKDLPLVEDLTFAGTIDGAGRYKKSKVLVERKTHKRLPDEDVRIWNVQSVIYGWAAREYGLGTYDSILWDYVRTKLPREPEKLKNGSLSKRKNIDTTWFHYLEAIHKYGLDPRDYREMKEKLRGREENFYRRVQVSLDEHTIRSVLDGYKRTALEIKYMQDEPVREYNPMACKMCDYKELCFIEVKGLDSEELLARHFKPAEERYEKDIGEEDGDDEE